MVLAATTFDRTSARHARPSQRVVGWLGLASLAFVWLQTTAVGWRVHSLIADYEGAHGDVSDQWYGRQPQAPEFAQLKTSLDGILDGGFWAEILWGGLTSLIVWFALWTGCSWLALRDRPVAWRAAILSASVIVVAQSVILGGDILAYIAITD